MTPETCAGPAFLQPPARRPGQFAKSRDVQMLRWWGAAGIEPAAPSDVNDRPQKKAREINGLPEWFGSLSADVPLMFSHFRSLNRRALREASPASCHQRFPDAPARTNWEACVGDGWVAV